MGTTTSVLRGWNLHPVGHSSTLRSPEAHARCQNEAHGLKDRTVGRRRSFPSSSTNLGAPQTLCDACAVVSKLYSFDGVSESLELIPLAARRALDVAGLKLSLQAWQGLALGVRQELLEAGSTSVVSSQRVAQLLKLAEPAPTPIAPLEEPSGERVPVELRETYGQDVLPDAVWSALGGLDRYVLAKVVTRGKERRIRAALDEIVGHSLTSTHVGPSGGVRMVNVSVKTPSIRSATAESKVSMSEQAYQRLKARDVPKGDVLSTARIAGIMGAKRTSELIPLCHPVALSRVDVELMLIDAECAVKVRVEAEAFDRTGVEMEALVAASTAALVIYDMLKGIDRTMVLGPTQLLAKKGGRSGDYRR